jgi:hypothetical protein
MKNFTLYGYDNFVIIMKIHRKRTWKTQSARIEFKVDAREELQGSEILRRGLLPNKIPVRQFFKFGILIESKFVKLEKLVQLK